MTGKKQPKTNLRYLMVLGLNVIAVIKAYTKKNFPNLKYALNVVGILE